ncbi:PilZ domain-containing protein [Geomonas terrae]|uniref:PilZ domain-containing protein n=1 Tax=Geomonas terrae TaxID=2562681 RepID=A0A4S1CF35_9BACT|nr:PilZ domain-containing protein [Geomonas terrae]TGU71646.1 PilZ domain-containing protein [Geomonas terrae]
MNQRRFHRVKHTAPGELKHHDMKYRCRIENISLRGALISADECLMVPLNESCTLSIEVAPGQAPMVVTVGVVHCFFSMMGVKFIAFEGNAEQTLLELIRRITTEPDKLAQEWESIQQEKAGCNQQTVAEPAVAHCN